MDMDKLRPGAVVRVNAGASLARSRPYLLAVEHVTESQGLANVAHVYGTQLRLDGTPTRQKSPMRADVVEVDLCDLVTPALGEGA